MRGQEPGATRGLELRRGPELRRLGLRRGLKLLRGQAFRRGSLGPGIPGRPSFAPRLVSIGCVTHRRLPAPPPPAPPVSGRYPGECPWMSSASPTDRRRRDVTPLPPGPVTLATPRHTAMSARSPPGKQYDPPQ